MKINKLINKYDNLKNISDTDYYKIYKILNIPFKVPFYKLYEYIFTPRFKGVGGGGEQTFDYFKDFDLIYALFRKEYGINLLKDDISWWEFTAILEEMILSKNALTKRMSFRAYKPQKKEDPRNKRIKNDLKRMYSLTDVNHHVQTQLGVMFNMAKRGE